MTLKTHKAIHAAINLVVAIVSFEALIAIINLNEPVIYIKTAFYIGWFYILQTILLYDLHYKNRGSLERARKQHAGMAASFKRNLKVFLSAFTDRCRHLARWHFFRNWLVYLILPGVIFWGTVCLIFINFGFTRIQQIFAVLSAGALFLNYWYLKEIFSRAKEVVDPDIFVVLSIVKIYASALAYGVIIALIRRYCLDATYAILGTFCTTFLLIFQALFQHRLVNLKNMAITLLICLVMAILSWGVLIFWGYNYFTAAIFLATCYNLMWAIFHHNLDNALTWQNFWEILIVSIIVAAMVLSVTNFKARILDDCRYGFTL